ncbi:MAG: hypothetical protein OMM_03655 [Candidatus Magnetoglobus multicellularis str. Araruama]|uniref:Zinc finger/thioredoxin putative domain-containing protein n=1 Tax=Candidatus Magnetoglobus multicellularis str. Araruama TaxID=890399 RepID=A0A1V1P524_9BACT|nr:MAG: hypothetical protein OMM_03655 [Candidatus Magnetoglobus multicellularis str. Araruama]
MKFKCKQCNSTYNIKEDRIPKGGGKVRCKVCKHVFKIFRPDEPSPLKRPKKSSTDISLPVIIVTQDQIKRNLLEKILDQYNIKATFYDNYDNFNQLPDTKQTVHSSAEPVMEKQLQAPKMQRLTDILPGHANKSRRRQIVKGAFAYSSDPHVSETDNLESIQKSVTSHVARQGGPLGLDIGTSHIVVAGAQQNRIIYKSDLNAFFTVPLLEVTKKTLTAHKIPFFVRERKIFVCGYPAQDFANIFNADIRRPIKDGLLSANEEDGFTVIRSIIEQIVPRAQEQNESIGFSVPGIPLNDKTPVTYHESVIMQYLKDLGYRPYPVNEGFATVISELADDAYSGIGISMGGGMCNVCLSYMAVPILTYSIQQGGDYIDAQAAESVGESSAKVKIVKQENLDLSMPSKGRIVTALTIFYDEIISALINSFIEVIDATSRIPRISRALPVVISGGTAMPPGFEDRFADALSRVSFPIRISEVRIATDPLYTTAKGAMIMAMSGGDIFPGVKNGR